MQEFFILFYFTSFWDVFNSSIFFTSLSFIAFIVSNSSNNPLISDIIVSSSSGISISSGSTSGCSLSGRSSSGSYSYSQNPFVAITWHSITVLSLSGELAHIEQSGLVPGGLK